MNYVVGNLLEANTEALVNTVNTAGVMGKGIALQFKERFPGNFKIYKEECEAGNVQVGKMLVVKENSINGEKLIINFPTKKEWYKKSQYSYIEEGLKDLVNVIRDYKIKSIAIPPLGSGNGGLKWENVNLLINKYLAELENVDILIYEPNIAVKEILQKEEKKNAALTTGRAMLLNALFEYEKSGEVASTFVANKLAYFLQKSGEQLRLKFVPYYYGPYAHAIDKVLYTLNGKYLTGMEQMSAKPFEPLHLNYKYYQDVQDYIKKNLSLEQHTRLKKLFMLINGFESPLSLEILSSVDYLLSEDAKLSADELMKKIQSWTERKKRLIDREHVEIALQRLNEYQISFHANIQQA